MSVLISEKIAEGLLMIKKLDQYFAKLKKYQNSVIYKIFCKDSNVTEIYVGSTINFNRRGRQHKSICSNCKSPNYNFPLYCYIRENGGWDNFTIEIIEYYPCRNKLELLKREHYYTSLLNATLNANPHLLN